MAGVSDPAEKLEGLLEELSRALGFCFSARERLAVNELLLALFERGELPADPARFKTLLAPIVCNSPEQQAEFHRRFEQAWTDTQDSAPPPPLYKRRAPRWRALAAAGLMVAVAASLAVWKYEHRHNSGGGGKNTGKATAPAVDSISQGKIVNVFGEPLNGVEVWSKGQKSLTGKDGSFHFSTAVAATSPLLLYYPDYGARIVTIADRVVFTGPGLGLQTSVFQSMGSIALRVGVAPDEAVIAGPSGALAEIAKSDVTVVRADATGTTVFSFDSPVNPKAVVFSPDGKLLAIGGKQPRVIDLSTAQPLPISFPPSSADPTAMAFSPDSKTLALDVAKQVVLLSTSGDGARKGPAIDVSVQALAVSPSGGLVAAKATASGKVSIDPIAAPPPSIPLSEGTAEAAFASSGRFPAYTASQPSYSVSAEVDGPVTSLSFSDDWHWLVVNSNRAQVFNVHTGEEVQLDSGPGSQGVFASDHQRLLILKRQEGAPRTAWWRWAAPAVPFFALGLTWLWLYRRNSRLRSYSLPREHAAREFRAPDAPLPFRNLLVRELGRTMRQRRPMPSREIAVSETVRATFRRGGFLTVVRASRRIEREYLVLLHKASSRDQNAELYRELFRALDRDHDVRIHLYTFQQSPERAREPDKGRPVGLSELASLHPNHDLWILADPAQLLDPIRLKLPPWGALLAHWQERSVVTPVEADAHAAIELEEMGVSVTTLPVLPEPRRYPALLDYLPERWLGTTPPPEPELARLTSELRRYLGPEGVELLAACAVYPELTWALTLWMATEICAEERRDGVIARVTSLPWFRYGRMPDWLRARLVNRLSPQAEARVRGIIDRFLKDLRAPDKGQSGDVSFGARGGGRKLGDYVMLEFLSGRKPDEKLTVKPTSWLQKRLFRFGMMVFGPRHWVHLAVAAVVAAGLGAAAQKIPAPMPTSSLTLEQYRLPSTPAPEAPLAVPKNPTERVMVLVAESQTPQALAAGGIQVQGDSYVDGVVAMAHQFAEGASGVPSPVSSSTPEPGLVVDGTFIEGAALRIGPSGRIAGVLPKGPYLDYSANASGPGARLSVDLSALMLPVRDLGSEGSVVGFAVAAAMEGQIQESLHQKIRLSPRYIYYLARGGGRATALTDSGAPLDAALEAMKSIGDVEESVWPYRAGEFAQTMPVEVATATHYRIVSFDKLGGVDAVKVELDAARPVVSSIDVFDSNSLDKTPKTGVFAMPTLKDKLQGAIAICIVGYDARRRLFKLIGSWGTGWGENGYGYLPYDYPLLESWSVRGIEQVEPPVRTLPPSGDAPLGRTVK
jgi:hypothetical protein